MTLLSSCFEKEKTEAHKLGNVPVPVVEREYFEVVDYEIFWDEIFAINADKYYVYIYSTTCSHCSEIKNWIIDLALNRKDIYFLKGNSQSVISTNISNTIGATEVKDVSILGYPTLLQISNKILTMNLAGNVKIKDFFGH